jgi:hypothetical protein
MKSGGVGERRVVVCSFGLRLLFLCGLYGSSLRSKAPKAINRKVREGFAKDTKKTKLHHHRAPGIKAVPN